MWPSLGQGWPFFGKKKGRGGIRGRDGEWMGRGEAVVGPLVVYQIDREFDSPWQTPLPDQLFRGALFRGLNMDVLNQCIVQPCVLHGRWIFCPMVSCSIDFFAKFSTLSIFCCHGGTTSSACQKRLWFEPRFSTPCQDTILKTMLEPCLVIPCCAWLRPCLTLALRLLARSWSA